MRNWKKKISLSLTALLIMMNVGTVTIFAKEMAEEAVSEEIVYTEEVVTEFDAELQIEEQKNGVYEVVTEDVMAEELETGDILILPATEEEPERAMEVTVVTETNEGYLIEGEEPESIFDVVESVNTEGTALVDTDSIVTEEGVTVVSTESTTRGTSWKDWFTFTSTGTTTMNGLRFHIDKQIGTSGFITGDISIDPSLEYCLIFDLAGVEEMTIMLDTQLEVSDVTVACSQAGSIPIATLPYTFAEGMFTAYVTMNLVYSAEGEIYLSYTINGECGITYDGNDTSLICSYEPELVTYGVSANGKVGAEFEVGLIAYGTYTLMNAELNAGIAALAQKEQGQTGYAEIYFYLDGSYGYGSVLEPYGICGAKVIYGKGNSPLRYEIAL